MSKRSWQDANLPSPHSLPGFVNTASPAQSHHSQQSSIHSHSPKKPRTSFEEIKPAAARPAPARTQSTSNANNNGADSRLPGISRKVKACAACRKQKIKCIMIGDPPCQRCKERGLSCKLNKSLQTLMSEDSRWKASVTKDVIGLYGSLERVLQLLNLPELPSLNLSNSDPAMYFEADDPGGADDEDDDEPSAVHSPKVTPITDNLSHVPIESLYQITGMKSLRATETVNEDQVRICKQLRDTDFISRGVIKIEDAEFLANFYLKKLDPYIWHLASDYTDLESFRSRSPTLTACVLTVAALHDTAKSNLYTICGKEYRRLVANAMFERRIDIEYLRALVIGSYWLSDISWTLSGYAIRRASEFQFKQCYQIIADSIKSPAKADQAKLQESMVGLRIIYHLYVCDHHLSVLYGRSSIMRDNESYITGWENYLSSPLAAPADRRIAGQICLMYLMNQIRETLGPEDINATLPASAVDDIVRFEANLDDWIARFSRHNPHELIGQWPNKGAVMHFHWAKLYLTSYSLRGMPDGPANIPEHFVEFASAAVTAATNIITLLLEDKDARHAIGFVPHHVHGMIAFATMFLLKAATRHAEQLFIDKAHLSMLMGALARQFKATVVGKDHLIHRMAEGVEKMADMLDSKSRNRTPHNGLATGIGNTGISNGKNGDDAAKQIYSEDRLARALVNGPAHSSDGGNNNLNTGGFDNAAMDAFDFNDPTLGLGMPFFDFEGTTLNPADGSLWNFSN